MMIPSGMRRGAQGRGGVPLPLIVGGGVAVLLLIVVAWTLLTMGREPTPEAVAADVLVAL